MFQVSNLQCTPHATRLFFFHTRLHTWRVVFLFFLSFLFDCILSFPSFTDTTQTSRGKEKKEKNHASHPRLSVARTPERPVFRLRLPISLSLPFLSESLRHPVRSTSVRLLLPPNQNTSEPESESESESGTEPNLTCLLALENFSTFLIPFSGFPSCLSYCSTRRGQSMYEDSRDEAVCCKN